MEPEERERVFMQEERRDGLRAAIDGLRSEIGEQTAMLRAALQELGTLEEIRQRRVFIEMLIEREKDRAKLRHALIEKSFVGAIVFLIVFALTSSWHEIGKLITKGVS